MSSALLSTNSVPEIARQCNLSSDTNGAKTNHHRPVYIQPPDKGWGWMVVFAAFMCSAIVDGLIFSFPCVFGLLTDDVHASYWIALLSSAVQICSYLLVGPIVSKFLRQDTCRQFVCCGAVLATTGFLASGVLANELPSEFYFIFVLTLGLIVGCGLGCIYISSICAVSCFFVRHRVAATTIALSGSGVGMTVFPPLIAHFTRTLDFYEAMFYFAAISFQPMCLGLLIWPLSELPPGCDIYAGQLPREKDIFDYIREQFGYPRSGGSRDSDISLAARQNAVKAAKQRRIDQLRMISECDPNWATRMDSRGSGGDSPQPSLAGYNNPMSPIRDFINRKLKRGTSRNSGSDAPSGSPASTSGPGTPVMYSNRTAPALMSSIENAVAASGSYGASTRRQSTIPDQVFSQPSQTSSSVPATSDLQSIAGGVSMAENISIITDVGRKLEECSEVSEFLLVYEPQSVSGNHLGKTDHTPRNKSVSECIHPSYNNSGGALISSESYSATDVVPPSQSSAGDDSKLGDGSVVENGLSISPDIQQSDADAVNFVVGSVPDEDVLATILREQAASTGSDENAKPNDSMENGDANMTRIDSEIGDLPNSLDHASQSVGKRLYRRQSSSRSNRLAVIRQRSLQKAADTAQPNAPASNASDAILQIIMNEQQEAGTAPVSGETSPAVRSESSLHKANGLAASIPSIPTTSLANGGTPVNLPSPVSKSCPLLSRIIDVRLFSRGSSFPILCLANAFAMSGIFIPLLYFPLRIIWLTGLQPAVFDIENRPAANNLINNARLKAGFLVAVAGSIGCIARLGVVIGSEFRRSNPLITTCVAFFVKAVVVVSSPLISEFAVLAVMLGFLAICTELFVSMTTSIIRWSFQPQENVSCDSSLVNPAFSLLTIIRAFSAAAGLAFAGYLFTCADPLGSCLLVIPLSPFRAYGVELPQKPEACDAAFANIMYFAGSVFFVSFILHLILLAQFAVRTHKHKKVTKNAAANTSTTTNGTFLLQKIDESQES